MKKIAYILLSIAALLFIYWCTPKSCQPSGKYEQLESKSELSKLRDSIKTSQFLIFKKHSDSLISLHQKKDSVASKKISTLEAGYKPLRDLIKHLTSVRVDSISQIVIVPVEQYNAFVESGNKCDSMQVLQKVLIAEKDSVNMQLASQVKAEQAQNVTTSQALADQTALTTEEKEKVAKGKKINKVLIKIIVVETAILAILAIVI